jgi:uncharacterized membrane protein YfcA
MEWTDWLYPAIVLGLGYLVLGITGFGSALVTVPLLAWIWPLPEVVVLAILLDIPASILHGGLNFRQVRWNALNAMLPDMAVGSVVGLWLLGQLDKRWPLFVLGIYIAIVGLRALRVAATPTTTTASRWGYHAGSTVLGVVEVMFATAGPVVLALLQRRLPNVAEIRATVPVVMVVAGSVAIAVLAISDQVNSAQTFERWIIGLPIAALGVLIGNRLAKQIPAVIMKRTIALLLIASGLSLTRHIWL